MPDVQIHFTGLRPGEKLHETLFGGVSSGCPPLTQPSGHPAGALPGDFTGSLDKLYAAAADGDDELIRILLGELVPEYRPDHGLATASVPGGRSQAPQPCEPVPG